MMLIRNREKYFSYLKEPVHVIRKSARNYFLPNIINCNPTAVDCLGDKLTSFMSHSSFDVTRDKII